MKQTLHVDFISTLVEPLKVGLVGDSSDGFFSLVS
jgi:hypothetical protein